MAGFPLADYHLTDEKLFLIGPRDLVRVIVGVPCGAVEVGARAVNRTGRSAGQ